MKKGIRIGIRIIALIFILMLIYLLSVIAINVCSNYRPENSSLTGSFTGKQIDTIGEDVFSVLTWNIGYGGLGENADFFYDGGRMVYPGRAEYQASFKGILNKINAFDSLDFLLLQEVDSSSRRSYYEDQQNTISDHLKHHHSLYAKYYDVLFIPIPLLKPLSKVSSGLSLFSRYVPAKAGIVVFPGNYEWPKNLFTPDRLFMYCEYTLASGKKLHLVNTHNSAFDDGSLRKQQIGILWDYMQQWYRQGDYVIVGGDWNVNPRGYQNTNFASGDRTHAVPFDWQHQINDPEWTFAYDPQYPTNRDVSDQYHHPDTPTTIIDYFVCSPNIEALNVKTHHDGFRYSDHQPVYLRFKLIQ